MTEAERLIYLRFSWYPPDTLLLGDTARPLCFATWNAMEMMGLRILRRDVELDPEEEYREIMAYVWLHSEEPEEISRSLWEGSWRCMLEVPVPEEKLPMDLLGEWRSLREKLLNLLEATQVKIRPRERSKNDDTPFEVIGPDEMAHRLGVVQRATRQSDEDILWNMPLYQFHQKYHAEMRWNSFWTVRGVVAKSDVDMEGIGEDVMENLKSQLQPAP